MSFTACIVWIEAIKLATYKHFYSQLIYTVYNMKTDSIFRFYNPTKLSRSKFFWNIRKLTTFYGNANKPLLNLLIMWPTYMNFKVKFGIFINFEPVELLFSNRKNNALKHPHLFIRRISIPEETTHLHLVKINFLWLNQYVVPDRLH